MLRFITILFAVILIAQSYIFFLSDSHAEKTSEIQEQVVNIYSSRKEELIRNLFDKFTKETNIKVNFVTDKAGKLISRLQAEGDNSSADLFLTADVGNLSYASELGLLDEISSEALTKNIPSKYRSIDWFGLSIRARPIFYNKDKITPNQLSTYEDLADPKWKGRILIRSSSNVYNQSLLASLIEVNGLEKTEKWASGLVTNFARKPQGGDTDQLRALAAGVGDIAVANSYYYGRLVASKKEADKQVVAKIAIFFPNQGDRGTHVNISGGAVLKYAKNRDNAIKLLEFLSSTEAQKIYAEVNHEYPVLTGIKLSDILSSFGEFKQDELPLSALSKHRSEVLKIADRAGWR